MLSNRTIACVQMPEYHDLRANMSALCIHTYTHYVYGLRLREDEHPNGMKCEIA